MNTSSQRVRIHVLLEILLPVKCLVTVVTLDVLGPRVNDHVRLYVGFLGKGLATHTAPVVLLTCRTRADQIVNLSRNFGTFTQAFRLRKHIINKESIIAESCCYRKGINAFFCPIRTSPGADQLPVWILRCILRLLGSLKALLQ